MKIKNYLLLLAVAVSVFITSCNNHGTPPLTQTSGAPIQDTVLPKLLVKFVHIGPGSCNNYMAYYGCQTLKVDSSTNPPTLRLTAQSAYYDSVNTSSVLQNTGSTTLVSSMVSVNTDTVVANYAGPFDIVNGQLYSSKGYLYYYNKSSGTTQVCPLGSIVYINQGTTGGSIAIGFVSTQDLH